MPGSSRIQEPNPLRVLWARYGLSEANTLKTATAFPEAGPAVAGSGANLLYLL
jgi:hypothetical protein